MRSASLLVAKRQWRDQSVLIEQATVVSTVDSGRCFAHKRKKLILVRKNNPMG